MAKAQNKNESESKTKKIVLWISVFLLILAIITTALLLTLCDAKGDDVTGGGDAGGGDNPIVECEHNIEILPAVAPTCEEKGLTEGKKCSKCGEIILAQEEVSPLGHNWGEWRLDEYPLIEGDVDTHSRVCLNDSTHIDVELCDLTGEVKPTCFEDGYLFCEICGRKDSPEGYEATGHVWGELVDNGDGTHTKICANDSSHTEIEDHILVLTPTEPTCEEDGVYMDVCECGYSCPNYSYEPQWPLGHDYVWTDNGDGTCTGVCSRDATHTITQSHELEVIGEDPDCENGGYCHETCLNCGLYVYTEYDPLGHIWLDWSHSESKTAEEGVHYHSRQCQRYWDENVVCTDYDYAPCTFEVIEEVPATCLVDGSITYKCTVCGHTYTETVTARGHHNFDYEDRDETNHFSICADCGEAYDIEPHTEYLTETVVPATCEAQGYTEYMCTYCLYTYKDNYVDALGHNWGEWTDNGDGTHTRVCANDSEHTETVPHVGMDDCVCDDCGFASHVTHDGNIFDCDICGADTSFTLIDSEHMSPDVSFTPEQIGTETLKDGDKILIGYTYASNAGVYYDFTTEENVGYKITLGTDKAGYVDLNEYLVEVVKNDDGTYSFLTNFGKYLAMDSTGALMCLDTINGDSSWTIVSYGPGNDKYEAYITNITNVGQGRTLNFTEKPATRVSVSKVGGTVIKVFRGVNVGHEMSVASNNDNTHTYVCTGCDLNGVEDCHGGTATCTDKATCTGCGAGYGEVSHVGMETDCTCDVCGLTNHYTHDGNIHLCDACGNPAFEILVENDQLQEGDKILIGNNNFGQSTGTANGNEFVYFSEVMDFSTEENLGYTVVLGGDSTEGFIDFEKYMLTVEVDPATGYYYFRTNFSKYLGVDDSTELMYYENPNENARWRINSHGYGDADAVAYYSEIICLANGVQLQFTSNRRRVIIPSFTGSGTAIQIFRGVNTGHQVTYTDNGDGTHTITCSVCGVISTDEACYGGTATCTDKAICDVCNSSYGDALGHAYPDTWTDNGENHIKVCANGCGIDLTEAHSYTETSRVEADCYNDGKITYSCACGNTYDETIKSQGHIEGEAEREIGTDVGATCVADGYYYNVTYCTECDRELEREQVAIPAIGHDYPDTWTDNGENHIKVCANGCGVDLTEAHNHVETSRVDATCENDGSVIYACECGNIKTETIPATGHDYEYVDNGDGTCTGTCTREGCTEDTDGHTTLPEAHIYKEDSRQDATCTADGMVILGCIYCDNTRTESLTAKGHSKGNAVVKNNIDPTCTETGSYDNVFYCDTCGIELERESKIVDPLGHKIITDKGTDNGDGTCTGPCERCGETVTLEHRFRQFQRDGEAQTHSHTCYYCNYEEVEECLGEVEVISPTCTTQGRIAYKPCDKCAGSGKTLILPAIGHDLDEETIVVNEDGTHTGVCVREGCGETITDKHYSDVDKAGNVIYCCECGEMIITAVESVANSDKIVIGYNNGTGNVFMNNDGSVSESASASAFYRITILNGVLYIRNADKKYMSLDGNGQIKWETSSSSKASKVNITFDENGNATIKISTSVDGEGNPVYDKYLVVDESGNFVVADEKSGLDYKLYKITLLIDIT